ncbi:relaxin receptor 2-like [Mytilus edulis]|uniref:relaxin receptor 2-like n=1 Tax=Mytilus edulis TaxID=6550 RepID=UPI0039EF5D03
MTPLWVSLAELREYERRRMSGNFTLADDNEAYDDSILPLLTIAHDLYIYYVPFIICLGTILNLFITLVLLKTRLRKRFHSHIVAAIAICDIGFLVALLFIWIKDQGIEIYRVPGLCQMVIFMSHFFPFLSFWHMIATCFIIMICPKNHCLTHTCNNVGKARTLVISLSIFTFTIYIYKTWTNGVVSVNGVKFCTILPETEAAMSILNILDMVVLLLLPFFLLIFFQILTIINFILKTVVTKSIGRSYLCRDYFKVIFAYSICFHIFVGPGCISKILVLFRMTHDKTPTYNFKDIIIENFIQYIFYTYFAIKPLVYMIVSRSFRYHFKELITKAKQTINITRTLVTNSQSQEQTLL